MEKYLKYIFFLLAVLGIQVLYAQEASKQAVQVTKNNTGQIDLSSTPAADLKHLQGDIGSGAVNTVNPAKPPASSDDKIGSVAPYSMINSGSTNSIPRGEIQKDTKLQPDGTLLPSKESPAALPATGNNSAAGQNGNNKQPEGIPAKGNINYRNISGPATQPEPPIKGKVTNYREMKGPGDQPKGAEPLKK
jgi:hypothetical protein